MFKSLLLVLFTVASVLVNDAVAKTCTLSPLGEGKDDTSQVCYYFPGFRVNETLANNDIDSECYR